MNRLYAPHESEMKLDRSIKLLPIVLIFGFILLSGLIFLILTTDNFGFLKRAYLIPWSILSGIVFGLPTAYLFFKNKFQIYHPLVFPVLFYFYPAFFLGGFILAFGFSDPYFMSFIQDQEYNLPFSMVLAMLGIIGLTIGFFFPLGGVLGAKLSTFLPDLKWDDDNVILPGVILLGIGFFNQILGFVMGVIGFQKGGEIGTYDGIIFLTTLLWMQASFLLWVALFRRNKLDFTAVMTVGLLMITALTKALFAGNRGSFLQIFTVILMSYVFAGRKINLKQGLMIIATMVVLTIVGMIYGTTFRQVKGSEERVDTGKYVDSIFTTFDTIGTGDPLSVLQQSLGTLGERLDAVSSLAVVASNYEHLKPYEDEYGLDNNIYKDSVTFFIPRVFWKDKPVASEPRLYSELYFNFGESSFTITPMGDLLRNFGVIGVPLGMIFLGFVVRLIYSALLENQPFSYWRSTLFFMIGLSISYESFYGSIIPYMFKVGFIAVIGIIIIHFFIKKTGGKQ